MKRSALTTLVAVGLAAVTLVSTACSWSDGTVTQNQIDTAISDVRQRLQFSPNPIDFGLSTTKIDVQFRLSGSIRHGFSIESLESVPTNEALSTGVGTCAKEFFSSTGDNCTINVRLDRSVPGTPTSGTGTLRVSMRMDTDLTSFMNVDIPYKWDGVPTPPTSAVASTTAAVTTAAPTTAAPTTVAATTPAGQPAISVSPTGYNFGSVPYSSAAHNFVVTNIGGGTLTFTSFHYAVGNQFFYTIGNSCPGASLRAGQSCTVSIQVSSGGPDISPPPGSHADTMNIVSNGGNASISLSYTTPG